MAIKDEQIVFFENRISKRFKHLKKWAIRENIGAFRLYDRDIPEIPLRLDFYSDKNPKEAQGENRFATITLFERPYEKDDEEEWFAEMKKSMAETLEIPEENIFSKIRSKKRGADQYEKFSSAAKEIVVSEGEARFLINLSDYLDTGLFFDLRLLRQRLRSEATGKRILNLFLLHRIFFRICRQLAVYIAVCITEHLQSQRTQIAVKALRKLKLLVCGRTGFGKLIRLGIKCHIPQKAV